MYIPNFFSEGTVVIWALPTFTVRLNNFLSTNLDKVVDKEYFHTILSNLILVEIQVHQYTFPDNPEKTKVV